MVSERASDFLMWIGGSTYPRELFIEEAKKMGVCRIIPAKRTKIGDVGLPVGLVNNVSRFFLISDMTLKDKERYDDELRHRDRERYRVWREMYKEEFGEYPTSKGGREVKKLSLGTPSIKGEMPRGLPVIFGYFTVRGIVHIVTHLSEWELRADLASRGITEYECIAGAFGFNDERLCGSLRVGATYILSEEDMEKIAGLADSQTVEGQFAVFRDPIPYEGSRFRGVKKFLRSQGDHLIETMEMV